MWNYNSDFFVLQIKQINILSLPCATVTLPGGEQKILNKFLLNKF